MGLIVPFVIVGSIIAALVPTPKPDRAAMRRAAHREDQLEIAGVNQLTKGLDKVNSQLGENLFSGSAGLGPTTCTVHVDGNVYAEKSEQDKHITVQIVGTLCVAAYRAPFGDKKNVRNLPDDGLHVVLKDLSGNEIDSDLWTHN